MTCPKCDGEMEDTRVLNYGGMDWVIWRCKKCKHGVIKPRKEQ